MAINERSNDSVEFKVVSRIGVIAEYQTGWTKELNIVIWNGGNPKYDLRDWNPEHDRMTRGITLHEEEAKKLCEILSKRFESGATLVSRESGRNGNYASSHADYREATDNANQPGEIQDEPLTVDNSDSPGELYEEVAGADDVQMA